MKAPSQTVIDDLQSAAGSLAHLCAQFKVDAKELKAMGLKWLAARLKTWAGEINEHQCLILKRLLAFGVDPKYDIGSVAGGGETVDAVMGRAEDLLSAALDMLCDARKTAWDAKADYTPDIYEHAVKDVEHALIHVERERALIAKLGEDGYTGARLEDNA